MFDPILVPLDGSLSDLYTLYEHCRRAIEKGTTSGAHGLPLMGYGDWNEGMNRVGIAGRGESVWLGWFLYSALTRFGSLCLLMKDDPEPYQQQAECLAQALESHAPIGAYSPWMIFPKPMGNIGG